uniref:Serine protease 43 n=1 Tax=Cricetulus griseus TaxID=10029 RepID=A0A8C2LUU4_CRIGR
MGSFLRGDRGGFLALLAWLQLLQPLFSGTYRPREDSRVMPTGPEASAQSDHVKSLSISDPSVVPVSPDPTGTPGSGTPWPTATQDALKFGGSFPGGPFFAVLLTEPCGHRIMEFAHGRPSAVRKWPWQVSLQRGSLINRQWVLTAAHCIYGQEEYAVMLGDNALNPKSGNGTLIPGKDIIYPSSFDLQTMQSDIALALLVSPVNFSPLIQPVCLPGKPFQVENRTSCWVTGWSLQDENVFAPVLLQEAQESILLRKRCNQVLQTQLKTTEDLVIKGMICGRHDSGQSPCWGDSGSPLVCESDNRWTQVGIVSWGINCGSTAVPSVYTDIVEYKEWVKYILSQPSCVDSVGLMVLHLLLMLQLAILVML